MPKVHGGYHLTTSSKELLIWDFRRVSSRRKYEKIEAGADRRRRTSLGGSSESFASDAYDARGFFELLDEKFIGYTNNTGIIHSIRDTLEQTGMGDVCLKETYQAAEDNAVASMLREGLGIAFIADNPLIHRNDLVFLHVENPYFTRKLYMVWEKDRYLSPAVKAFKYYVLSKANSNN